MLLVRMNFTVIIHMYDCGVYFSWEIIINYWAFTLQPTSIFIKLKEKVELFSCCCFGCASSIPIMIVIMNTKVPPSPSRNMSIIINMCTRPATTLKNEWIGLRCTKPLTSPEISWNTNFSSLFLPVMNLLCLHFIYLNRERYTMHHRGICVFSP